jgi:hypothetical protein
VVRRDVKFEENLASRKSHEFPTVTEDTQQVDPKDEKSEETSNARGQGGNLQGRRSNWLPPSQPRGLGGLGRL